MAQIEETLRELDRWYNEVPGGTDRPRLLAKLAILELCGWLEDRLDSIVKRAGALAGVDDGWTQEKVLKENYGFTYQDHLRKMLSKLVGEAAVSHLEQTVENTCPGTLDQLKGSLTTLYKSRGVLAHTYTGAPVAQQQTLNAPSWAINRHRVVAKMLDQFEGNIMPAFGRTIARPPP